MIVHLYKGKGESMEGKKYRSISMLNVVGKSIGGYLWIELTK